MKCEAVHCQDRRTVRFAVYPDGFEGPRILAEVTEEFLWAMSGRHMDSDALVRVCEQNFESLERLVIRRFRLDPRQRMLVGVKDLASGPA